MLKVIVPAEEYYDDVKNEFIYCKEETLELEHSLISLAKWESKWHKAFLGKQQKTDEETIDYIRCMTLNKKVDPSVYKRLSNKNIDEIYQYINDPMTAVHFQEVDGQRPSRDISTAEVIYYWMIANQIPFDPCQKWHLNRLLALIRVVSMKNNPKKMSKNDILRNNKALNEARKAKHKTKG